MCIVVGPIPPELADLNALTELDLRCNELSGYIGQSPLLPRFAV